MGEDEEEEYEEDEEEEEMGRRSTSLVASVNEQALVGSEEDLIRAELSAIREDEGGPLSEDLDEGEDVVPLALGKFKEFEEDVIGGRGEEEEGKGGYRVESNNVIAKFVEDFFHLESGLEKKWKGWRMGENSPGCSQSE